MAKPGYTGFTRILKATKFSSQGFHAAWKNESAFRQECTLGIFMLPAAFLVGQTILEILLLVSVLAFVLITELLNSAIEAVVDRIGAELHELSGRAKDMGSAAVFVSLAITAIVWTTMIIRNIFFSDY